MPLPPDDPLAVHLYGLAWEKAIERLAGPPHSPSGPFTKEEHLALLATLSDLSAAMESTMLTATYWACSFEISQAEVGRACGISRQAVRQRLAKATAELEAQRHSAPHWDLAWGDYTDED